MKASSRAGGSPGWDKVIAANDAPSLLPGLPTNTVFQDYDYHDYRDFYDGYNVEHKGS